MKHPRYSFAPAQVLPESERSIDDLMADYARMVDAFNLALQSRDAAARGMACDALKEAHCKVLEQLFAAYRMRNTRAIANRAAGIDPDGPQPVGYISPSELEQIDNEDVQAYIEPPTLGRPKDIPLWTERPLSATRLADELRGIATRHANGHVTDFLSEARRILDPRNALICKPRPPRTS
jgi:hypothetical protein